MKTPTSTRRVHLLHLTVSEDVRREMRFTETDSGITVYTFDGLENGEETTRVLSREEARPVFSAAIAEGYVWTRSLFTLPESAPVQASPVVVAVPEKRPRAPGFESVECSRCGGTGKHSHCQMYGDTCFQCSGAGRTMTKRGAAASACLTALRSKPARDVAVGDTVQMRSLGGAIWTTVRSIEAESDGRVTIVTGDCAYVMDAAKPVRVRQTSEQSLATWAQAMAYQASLPADGRAVAA